MKPFIDLQSDTVTRPGPAMREVMARAEVGDDGRGADPTVNRLEAMAAGLMGKEAAVFVASGTMGNLVALMAHTQPGDEIIAGDECHIFNYELGGSARIAGVQTHVLRNTPDGGLDHEEVAAAMRPVGTYPPTTLLCLENTHNRCGGAAIPLEEIDALATLAHERGLKVHLDGARIFNAATALVTGVSRLVRECDSVAFCLSKGLGCPVGSLLCGDAEFVERARRFRRMVGGGMRQAGVLAAAGIYALENNLARLGEDHDNARRLASGLREYEAFRPNTPETNIVLVDVVRGDVDGWLEAFREEGVGAVAFGPQRMRMVTHLDITTDDIDDALGRIDRAVAKAAA